VGDVAVDSLDLGCCLVAVEHHGPDGRLPDRARGENPVNAIDHAHRRGLHQDRWHVAQHLGERRHMYRVSGLHPGR
jgi:hypothetical protein